MPAVVVRITVGADEQGALVLSEFTGAAAELDDAFLINAHDTDDVGGGIPEALNAESQDLVVRMRHMREQVRAYDIAYWARDFLKVLGVRRNTPRGRAGRNSDVLIHSCERLSDVRAVTRARQQW
ncbi:glycosyl transferase family 20 [Actinoplanes teichomyceticus]|uniref:Glycosyl transferase family 20 n=1 Tax=Actinoplanes teichomyceticus TaxID=1867 RepID=A0A561WLH9_ACTTI|nr:glycosyl transferase family 20 [Actinoplanes teichomyceticus]GIF14613.1 hypothetical protein Ate01nite_46450 [Actinoplanes teichomyceticus]